jgi:hypothetical protein
VKNLSVHWQPAIQLPSFCYPKRCASNDSFEGIADGFNESRQCLLTGGKPPAHSNAGAICEHISRLLVKITPAKNTNRALNNSFKNNGLQYN